MRFQESDLPLGYATERFNLALAGILSEGKSQYDKFKDAARDLGCDENEAVFEEKLKKIAKAPPAAQKDTAKTK